MRKCFACAWRSGFIRKGAFSAIFLFLCSSAATLQAGPRWGEFGGSLDYLRSCYMPPLSPGESNFYIDMLDGSFRRFAIAHGLTNNHALFVVSHGKALQTDFGLRYAFYPEKSSYRVPSFSAGDLARLIGPANARQIQILVLAGCNRENLLSLRELKRYFPNAATIIHALPGTDANLASFWEMLAYRSQDLAALRSPHDLAARHFGPAGFSKGSPYVADLYQPGARTPYRRQIAGRELFTPTNKSAPLAPATATPAQSRSAVRASASSAGG